MKLKLIKSNAKLEINWAKIQNNRKTRLVEQKPKVVVAVVSRA